MSRFYSIAPGVFVFLWATGFISARYAMPWAEPFLFLALRFAFAFALLVAIVAILRRPRRHVGWSSVFHAMFAGCLMHGIYLGGVFWAIKNGMPAGLSALIVGLQPLVTALMAAGFLGDRVTRRQWTGLAVGFAGVVMVLQPVFGATGDVTLPTLAAAVVGVTGMSAGTIWQKRFGGETGLMTSTIYQYLGASIVMFLLFFAFEEPVFIINGELVFAMAWAVFVLSIGAIFLLMILIREGEVAKVASLFYLVPGVTAVLAWFLFGEDLSALQIAGMIVAAIGVAFATGGSAPAPSRQ